METKKNVYIIFVIIIILISIFVIVLGADDILKREELSTNKNELSITKMNLKDNITKLTNTTELLNMSNLFFNTYLVGLGTYYNATEIQETAEYKMEQARIRYDDGYWSNSLAWYWDSMNWFNNAWQKFEEAKLIFDNTTKYSTNSTYQNICIIYSHIMNTSSDAMIYAYEASEYYAKTCEFYLDNNYKSAYDSYNNAELKMTYYDEEIAAIQDYQNELNIILVEIN